VNRRSKLTLGTHIKTVSAIAGSALMLAGAAQAANINVVRDVASRDARTLPISPIEVVRDVASREFRTRQVRSINVVRDTPARDAAQAKRRGEKAIAYFRAMERSAR
jgi:hypothetical protein